MREATGESVELAYVDRRGYTGEGPAAATEARGMRLEVVKHPGAKKGLVLLPRRWVVERALLGVGFTLPAAGEGLREAAGDGGGAAHFVAFACLMLNRAPSSPSVPVHNTL